MNNNQSLRARHVRPNQLIHSACSRVLEKLENRQLLAVDPVIVFEFNEGTGLTAADASAEGGFNNGTLVGTDPLLVPTWGAGTPSPSGGSYLTFAGDSLANGQGGRVDTATPLSTVLGNSSTISYWMRTTATGSDTPWLAPAVSGVELAGGANDIFLGSLTGTGRTKAQAGNGANATSRNPINDGNWHRIIHSYDAATGQMRTYVDGMLTATVTSETGPKTLEFNSIGALALKAADLTLTGHVHLNADLDQIEIFDRVLSPQEVATRFAPPAAGAPATPVVTASSEAIRSITLTWNDVPDAMGYSISRSLTGAPGSFTEVALVPADQTDGPTTRHRDINLVAGQTYFYEVVAFGQGGSSAPGTANFVAPATGNGISGHYYNTGFWGQGVRPADGSSIIVGPAQVHQLHGSELDINWGTTIVPAPGIPLDNFSTAWTGKIVATETGEHYILGYGDDDTHVFVNGALVSSDPGGHGIPGNNQGGFDAINSKDLINLTAGQEYDIVVLQSEQGGGAGIILRWITPTMQSTTGTSFAELVPVTSLRITTSAPVPATDLVASDFSGGRVGITFTDHSTSELRYVLERSKDGSPFVPVDNLPIVPNALDGTAGFGSFETVVTEPGSYTYRVRAINFEGIAVSATSNVVVVEDPTPTVATGVQGYYFNTQFWGSGVRPPDGQIAVSLTPDVTEPVTDINENWGTALGPNGLGITDNFSTVYVGKILAPETGVYQILGFSDDDSYVWVDGQLVSADPGGHGIPGNNAGGIAAINIRNPITLTAGQQYNVVAIQSEGGGGAGIILRWITPSDTTPNNATDIPEANYVGNIANAGPGALANGAPAAATNVRVDEADRQGTFVVLRWNDVASNELVYTVERTGPGGVVTMFDVPINSTSFTDATLTANTAYSYRVIASNFQGTTGSTALNVTTRVANEVPAGPTNTAAVSRANGVRVTFTDSSTTENEFTIQRAPVTGGVAGTFAEVGRIAGSAPAVSGGRFAFTDTSAVEGQVYAYQVLASNATGDSAPSNAVQITFVKPTGTGVRATYFPTINFQGDPIVLPAPIDLDENWGGGGPPELVADPGDTDPDDTISTRFEGYITPEFSEAYTFWAGADDGVAIQIVDPETGQILLNYNNLGRRGGIPATGFDFNAGTVNLVAGKKYALIVRIVEDQGGFGYRIGWSSPSNPQEVLPTELLTAPSNSDALLAPRAISADSVGTEQVTVTFDGNIANFTETGFEILRSTTGAPGSFSVVGTAPADSTTFADTTGLVVGQTLFYQVRAVRGATLGPESNVVSTVIAVGGTGLTLGGGATGSATILPGADGDPATAADNQLQLTDNVNDRIGTAFLTNGRAVDQAGQGTAGSTGFNTSFNFTIPEKTTNPADGFTFVIQRNTPTAIGGGGGALGYVGMPNSVAVEFDFYNGVNDVGVYANGYDLGNDPAGVSVGTGLVFTNGNEFKVEMSYNATTNELMLKITDLTDPLVTPFETTFTTARVGTPAAPSDETLDITQLIGGQQAFFGFTGATGGLNADQRISNWVLNGEFIPFVITDNQWTGGAGGTGTDFAQGTNWQTGAAPAGPTSTAKFGTADPNAGNVDVNSNVNVGTIVFDSSNPYNLQGTGTITLGAAGTEGNINVVNGTHTIGNAIVAPGGVEITLASTAGGLTVGNVSGNVTVSGDGKTVNTGAITDGTLTVNSGATVKTSGTSDLDGVTLSGAPDAWTSRIDIADGAMVVRSSEATRDADLARVRNMILQGLNLSGGAFWTGNGITSSTAAANSGGILTAVGVILNDFAQVPGLPAGPIVTEFNGLTVGQNDILVKYTYFGDADLNGVVDATDYSLIDNAFNLGLLNGGWLNGDFDFNGVVDATDYSLIDNAFNSQGAPLSGEAAAPAAAVEAAPAAAPAPAPATSSGKDEISNVFAGGNAIGGAQAQSDEEEADEDDDVAFIAASSDAVL